MAAIIAVPNPSITKDESISPCVIMSVIALITKRKKPSDRTVIGNVKTTKIGLIMIFKMDKITLANNAGPNPSSVKDSKNCATTIKAMAFKKIDTNHRKNISVSPIHSV